MHWVFLEIPPSSEMSSYLDDNGIWNGTTYVSMLSFDTDSRAQSIVD